MNGFSEFMADMYQELERADEKHGNWDDISLIEGASHIRNEANEVMEAALSYDIDSEHGVMRESVQTAVTSFKLWRKVREHSNE